MFLIDYHTLIMIKNKLINKILNLEKELNRENRIIGVRKVIMNILIPEIDNINSETDILNMLKKRSHLNNIPLKLD